MASLLGEYSNLGQLFHDLEQVTSMVNKIDHSSLSPASWAELHLTLEASLPSFQNYLQNKEFSDGFSGKKIALSSVMKVSLYQTILVLRLFQANFSPHFADSPKNMNQTVNSLFIHLKEEMSKFSKHLRELKDLEELRIGRTVEKIHGGTTSKQKEQAKKALLKRVHL